MNKNKTVSFLFMLINYVHESTISIISNHLINGAKYFINLNFWIFGG